MKSVIEKLRMEIQNTTVSVRKDHSLKITMSAGIAYYDVPTGGEKTAQDLFRAADTLLYLAKNSGRNNVKIQGDL